MQSKHNRILERVMTRLKLKQLRLLVAVGKHRSILHAARELNTSQPAATKMIKDLEADFDVQLFERTNRGVVPTIFGEAMIRHGKLIFAQISHAAQELDDLNDGASGRVVVGTLLAASSLWLPDAIARVTQQKPNLTIKIVEGTNEFLMPLLRSGELDFIVGLLPLHRHRQEVEQERFYDEQIVAVCRPGHPLAARKNLKLDHLIRYPWIVPPPETSLRRQLDGVFIDQGFSLPEGYVESVSYLANRALLRATDMIGGFPSHVAQTDIAAGVLVKLNWQVPIPAGPVGVSFRKNTPLSPAAQFLMGELRNSAADTKSLQSRA